MEWLQKTPETTTIRVNSLLTSTDNVIAHILEYLKQCDYLPSLPIVQRFDPLPEMIMIHSIDKNLINAKPNPKYKEVHFVLLYFSYFKEIIVCHLIFIFYFKRLLSTYHVQQLFCEELIYMVR